MYLRKGKGINKDPEARIHWSFVEQRLAHPLGVAGLSGIVAAVRPVNNLSVEP